MKLKNLVNFGVEQNLEIFRGQGGEEKQSKEI